MGRVYSRRKGGVLYGDYTTPEGKRIQRSLRTRDRAVAKERLRQAELAATPQARGRKQRLSEAIDYVISLMHDRAQGTREMYEQKGRRILETLGDPMVQDVSRDMVSSYIARRLGAEVGHGGADPHTIQKELIVMRRALRESHERGVLTVMPPFPRFSAKYKPREVWLTPDEFERVCAHVGRVRKRERPNEAKYRARRKAREKGTRAFEQVNRDDRVLWLSLAALAGGNQSEVEGLRWPDVKLDAGWMRIRGKKRESRDRNVPIAPALHPRLAAAYERAKAKANGAEPVGPVVPAWPSVRRELGLACKRAELGKHVSPNDLRRTFASWLVQSGVALLTVATLMGHSSTRMVEKVYGRLAPENLEAAIANLPRFLPPPAPALPEPPSAPGPAEPD